MEQKLFIDPPGELPHIVGPRKKPEDDIAFLTPWCAFEEKDSKGEPIELFYLKKNLNFAWETNPINEVQGLQVDPSKKGTTYIGPLVIATGIALAVTHPSWALPAAVLVAGGYIVHRKMSSDCYSIYIKPMPGERFWSHYPNERAFIYATPNRLLANRICRKVWSLISHYEPAIPDCIKASPEEIQHDVDLKKKGTLTFRIDDDGWVEYRTAWPEPWIRIPRSRIIGIRVHGPNVDSNPFHVWWHRFVWAAAIATNLALAATTTWLKNPKVLLTPLLAVAVVAILIWWVAGLARRDKRDPKHPLTFQLLQKWGYPITVSKETAENAGGVYRFLYESVFKKPPHTIPKGL